MENKKRREVITIDNFFSIQLNGGEQITITINNGEKVMDVVIPYDALLNCYLKRTSEPLFYKN